MAAEPKHGENWINLVLRLVFFFFFTSSANYLLPRNHSMNIHLIPIPFLGKN